MSLDIHARENLLSAKSNPLFYQFVETAFTSQVGISSVTTETSKAALAVLFKRAGSVQISLGFLLNVLSRKFPTVATELLSPH